MSFNRILSIKAALLGVVATTLISGQIINTKSSAFASIVAEQAEVGSQLDQINICNLFPWLCGWQKEPVNPNTVASGEVRRLTICAVTPWLCGWQEETAKPNTVASTFESTSLQNTQAETYGPTICHLFPWLCGWQKEPVNLNTVAIGVPSDNIWMSRTEIKQS